MRVWTKNTIYWKRWENFRKFFKWFLKKIAKKALFKHFFKKDLINHALIFCAFGRKTKGVGKFWENFEHFWWKFYRKIEFFLILDFRFLFFRKFVTKNRAFGNNTIFLQQFFRFRGGGDFPLPPGYAVGIIY